MSESALRVEEFKEWPKLREFIDTKLGQGFANTDYVFRGEREHFSSVIPLVDRLLPPDQCVGGLYGRLQKELLAMVRFRQNAPARLDPLQRSMLNPDIQLQVLMRHYGAPTRLLDWSESPWIALFFACEDAALPPLKGSVPDGRILCVDRTCLQRAVASRYSEESGAHATLAVNEYGAVPKILLKEFAEQAHDWVVCYHRHDEKFPRLLAQQGLFTIASKPWVDHWKAAVSLCPDTHYELRIASGLKPEAMRRLIKMGITAASLFPDIEGVAREIGADIRLFEQ